MNIQEKAAEVLEKFHTKTRGEAEIWVTDDESLREMCHKAHGDMMPDDQKYRFIVDALATMADADDPDCPTIEADIYTSELTAWLASSNSRVDYLTQALEEYGAKDGFNALAIAQTIEREEVYFSVLESIRAMVDEEEE